jgi:hypothetical protein
MNEHIGCFADWWKDGWIDGWMDFDLMDLLIDRA